MCLVLSNELSQEAVRRIREDLADADIATLGDYTPTENDSLLLPVKNDEVGEAESFVSMGCRVFFLQTDSDFDHLPRVRQFVSTNPTAWYFNNVDEAVQKVTSMRSIRSFMSRIRDFSEEVTPGVRPR